MTSDIDQTKLMGQLAYQTQVVIFGIRANLVFKYGEGARVEKGYPWMELENSSKRRATIKLYVTCTMLEFDLGNVRL